MNALRKLDRRVGVTVLALVIAVTAGTGCVPDPIGCTGLGTLFSNLDLQTGWDTSWDTGWDTGYYDQPTFDYDYGGGGYDGYDYVAQDLGYQNFNSWAGSSISTFAGDFVSYD